MSSRFQVFHVCQENARLDSYFCPNQTLFSQKYLTCDWWYNVDCQGSEQYYGLQKDLFVATTGGKVT